MISNAFKGAYVDEVSQQNQSIGNVTSGIKSAATLILGSLGFSGALGEGIMKKAATHALAGRIGGVGGNLMLASLDQKKATAEAASKLEASIKEDQSQQVKTVWETIQNSKGRVDTSLGEVDPDSKLGQKIKEEIEKNDNDR